MKPLFCRIRVRWLVSGMVAALVGWAVFEWIFAGPVRLVLAGSHGVGTTTFVIPGGGGGEPLVVQVWYPAERDAAGVRAPWYPDDALAPGFPFHRMAKARGRSVTDAPVPAGPDHAIGVIFYEHSWTGHRAENTALVENLASRGFVVVATDHPGQAKHVRYPGGRVVKSELPETLDFSSADGVSRFARVAEEALASRSRNLARVRQALAAGVVPQLAGRLELDRLGVLGYSFGGTHALRRCADDPAFVAGVNMDGFFLDGRMPGGSFLFIDQEMPGWLHDEAQPGEDAGQAMIRRSEARIRKALASPRCERLVLNGTTHESFCDRLFYCRIPQVARAGNRSTGELHGLLGERIAEFFVRALDLSR